jgi:hypothetical protein
MLMFHAALANPTRCGGTDTNVLINVTFWIQPRPNPKAIAPARATGNAAFADVTATEKHMVPAIAATTIVSRDEPARDDGAAYRRQDHSGMCGLGIADERNQR